MAPNNSFKPNLLRYTNNMAGKACHVVGSATQVGLTQALERGGKFMGIGRTLVLCIPTILVSAVSGFLPWGLVTAAVTLVLYGVVLFFPSKSVVRVNANVALEGLTYGDLTGAKDHVEIALREAESANNLGAADVELLRSASDKVIAALVGAGQIDSGNSLRKRTETVLSTIVQSAST